MKKIFVLLIFLLLISLIKAADQQGTIIVDIKDKNESFQKPPGAFPGASLREFTMPSVEISRDIITISLVIMSPPSIGEGSELPIKIRYRSEINNENLLFKLNSPHFDFKDHLIIGLENKKADFEMIGEPKKDTSQGEYNLTLDVFVNNVQYFSETFPVIVKSPLRIRILRNLEKNKFPLLFFLILLLIILLIYYYFKKRNRGKILKKQGKKI